MFQVATSQVKGLLGLQIPGRGFVNTWYGVFSNIQSVRPCDASVGFACIGILLFLRVSQSTWTSRNTGTGGRRYLRGLVWIGPLISCNTGIGGVYFCDQSVSVSHHQAHSSRCFKKSIPLKFGAIKERKRRGMRMDFSGNHHFLKTASNSRFKAFADL